MYIPFIFSESPNECWLRTSDACSIATRRLGLRAPLCYVLLEKIDPKFCLFVCLFVCLLYFNFVVFVFDLFFNSVLSLVGFFALIYEHKLIFPDGRFKDSLSGHRY